MRDLDAIQQASPEPVSRMSGETIPPPNEPDNIFNRLDKPVCDAEECVHRGWTGPGQPSSSHSVLAHHHNRLQSTI